MTLQDIIWTIALSGIAVVSLVFIYILLGTGKAADEAAMSKSARTARKIQGWLFIVLLLGFVFGTWATLRRFPIPKQNAALHADQVVDVTARMWSWSLRPASVEAGKTIEFRVTSADVNHGFALYAPDGHIVVQTQAMPEFTNRLLYRFDAPGIYTVQCLEYCGIGHAPMKTTFAVVAPKGD